MNHIFVLLLFIVPVIQAQSIPETAVLTTETFIHPTGASGVWTFGGNRSLFSTSPTTNSGIFYPRGKNQDSYFCSFNGFKSANVWVEGSFEFSQLQFPNPTLSYHWNIFERSISVLSIRDSSWNLLLDFLVHKSYGTNVLSGAILLPSSNLLEETFAIPTDGQFHAFAIGYNSKIGKVSAYIDGSIVLVKNYTYSSLPIAAGGFCGINTEHGLPNQNYGSFGIRSCTILLPDVKDIYVNSNTGNDDSNDGSSSSNAFKTIKKALKVVTPGATVHVADGIYRESFTPYSGLAGKPITLKADGKKAFVYGSIAGNSLTWTQSNGVWTADVSGIPYFPQTPRFVALMDKTTGNVIERFRIAREPNYKVNDISKFVEFWNVAEGGSSASTCTPGLYTADCDASTRSATILTDSKLKNYSNLVGSRIFIADCISGLYIYKRTIVAHNKITGTITVDEDCLFDYKAGKYAIGLYSAYYIEDHYDFMDEEGEYILDGNNLYVKTSHNPNDLEISISNASFSSAITLSGKSNLKFEGFKFLFFESAVTRQVSGCVKGIYGTLGSHNITFRNCTILYCNNGIHTMDGSLEPKSSVTHWIIDTCEFGFIDSLAVSTYTAATSGYISLYDYTLKNSWIHDVGFNSDADARYAGVFEDPKDFKFLNNKIERISHIGFQLDSTTTADGKISSSILFRGNIFSQTCCSNADCGCIKFASSPAMHNWKDVLITENICQSSFGWTIAASNRKRWTTGYGSFAYYFDHASGITLFRNIAYNNGRSGLTVYRYWEDTSNIVYNNLFVGATTAIGFGDKQINQTGAINVKNNVFYGQQTLGVAFSTSSTPIEINKIDLNNNLYWNVGWDSTNSENALVEITETPSKILKTFDAIHSYSPNWETTSYSFDPKYKINGTIFRTTSELYKFRSVPSHALDVTIELKDKGTSSLPIELTNLLAKFGIPDQKRGTNYDIGPTEMDSDGAIVESDLPINGDDVFWNSDNTDDDYTENSGNGNQQTKASSNRANDGADNSANESPKVLMSSSLIALSISCFIYNFL